MPASGCSWPVIIRSSVVLPAPFGPITPTIPPRGRLKLRSSISSAVAVRLAQAVGLDHDVAEPRTGGDVDLDLVELDVAVLGEQRLVGVEAGLGLVPARARVQAHPLELLVDRALARALLLLLVLQPGALLLEPARVVALVRDAAAAIELEDPAGDVVEEVAVVGDRDDRARVVLEVALEPGDRFGVEVVGRLVEQQQVGLAQQQPAERDAAPLAAGEGRDVGVGRAGCAARPSRSRAWCRGSSRRPRRSAPGPVRTRRRVSSE